MTRITALAVSMFLIVMPLTALAGGGEPPGPPTDSVVEVAPIFETTGNSGIVIVEAGGYSVAYQHGLAPRRRVTDQSCLTSRPVIRCWATARAAGPTSTETGSQTS